MKRNYDTKTLKVVLNKFIEKNSLNSGLDNVKVQNLWKKTMGDNVNSYTNEVILKNQTLYISLSSSILRQELSYGKDKIIELINKEFGQSTVKKIVLR
tara:strand:+ start:190 stop:483 length:294 start_codon:yes stop_codon:yes gene_type:complete